MSWMNDPGHHVSRTVLAFDSWTGGAAKLERLVRPLARKGLHILLLHIGSWGHDQCRAVEEQIGDLLVRDIAYYRGLGFGEILDREQPRAAIFLSTQAFAHRAFNRYCRQRRIPTIHVYHGLMAVQAVQSRRLNPFNFHRQLALTIERLPKNVLQLLPIYARALWETDAASSDWAWLAFDVWRKLAGTSYAGSAAPDSATDVCCVYTDADADHASARYHVPRDRVLAVGNPDLAQFHICGSDLGVALGSPRSDDRTIVYIDTALTEAGAVFDDNNEFVEHLIETRQELTRLGFRLIVKLHPAHSRTTIPSQLEHAGVDLCANDAFLQVLRKGRAALVEPSTAAMIPALLGVPLLLARYGKLASQEFGDVLLRYPRARELRDITTVPAVLAELESAVDSLAVRQWIDAHAGPLPSEQMGNRVADVCEQLIETGGPGSR